MRADDYFNGWVEEKTGKEEADGHTLYAEQLKGEDKKKRKKGKEMRQPTAHNDIFFSENKKKERKGDTKNTSKMSVRPWTGKRALKWGLSLSLSSHF